MNIVIMDYKTVTTGDVSLRMFENFGNVTYLSLTSEENVAKAISNADVVLCNKTPLNAKNMSGAKNLKYIGLFATGYNNIDIEYAKNHNITVCNAGSYSTEAVVQHTFSLLFEMTNKTAQYNCFVVKGGWTGSDVFSPFVYNITELCGKTMGIVGYGSIGMAVAKVAKAFSMNVLVYTRTVKNDKSVRFVSFDELLKSSDIISLHCPLNKQSEKLFNDDAFEKMKNSAFFINTARGGIVDEAALANALNNDKIRAAAVDTVSVEPMKKDCPLLKAKNLIITPHVAWAATETRQRLVDVVYNNLKNFIDRTPTNVVV